MSEAVRLLSDARAKTIVLRCISPAEYEADKQFLLSHGYLQLEEQLVQDEGTAESYKEKKDTKEEEAVVAAAEEEEEVVVEEELKEEEDRKEYFVCILSLPHASDVEQLKEEEDDDDDLLDVVAESGAFSQLLNLKYDNVAYFTRFDDSAAELGFNRSSWKARRRWAALRESGAQHCVTAGLQGREELNRWPLMRSLRASRATRQSETYKEAVNLSVNTMSSTTICRPTRIPVPGSAAASEEEEKKVQDIHLVLSLQPQVRTNGEQIHVKMCVMKLSVGPTQRGFVCDKEEGSMGFFPDWVALTLAPTVQSYCFEPEYEDHSRPPPAKEDEHQSESTTELSIQATAGLAPFFSVTVAAKQSWDASGKPDPRESRMVLHDISSRELPNAVCFGWKLLRWKDSRNSEYDPVKGVRTPALYRLFHRGKSFPALPFEHGSPVVTPFPRDAVWKFKVSEFGNGEPIPFSCRVEARFQYMKRIGSSIGMFPTETLTLLDARLEL